MNDELGAEEFRKYWDDQAAVFDDEPDHGLRDPAVFAAWEDCLSQWLPPPPGTVLDVGCGTGTLSRLLSDKDYSVTGVDFAAAMIAQAKQKAGTRAAFHVMDASSLAFPPRSFDVVLCRHLLWALPQPASVLQRWADLLTPGGRLVLIEGFWETGGGLHSADVIASLPAATKHRVVVPLSDQPALWGKQATDERYTVIAYF